MTVKKEKQKKLMVSIKSSNQTTYDAVQALKKELGCHLSDLVWYGLELVVKDENRPQKFGLS